MKDNYEICIRGVQTVNGQKDNIDLHTVGSFVTKNNKRYIIYDDYNDDNPNEKIMTVLSLGAETVSIRRSGAISNNLTLEKRKRHTYIHHTSLGELKVGIFTHELKDKFNENGGELYARYTVDFNSQVTSENELYIKVDEMKNFKAGDKKDV